MSKKPHTNYIDKPQEQKQDAPKQQQGGGGGGGKRPNQIMYLVRVAWRFYSKIFTEAVLALVLVLPFYGYFYATGVKEIVLPTNLWVLWAIATEAFILQGLMFSNK